MHTLSYCFNKNERAKFEFSYEKNSQLKAQRNISFEEAILAIAIEEGNILDILPHPNVVKHPEQFLYVLNIKEYAYIMLFVIKGQNIHF